MKTVNSFPGLIVAIALLISCSIWHPHVAASLNDPANRNAAALLTRARTTRNFENRLEKDARLSLAIDSSSTSYERQQPFASSNSVTTTEHQTSRVELTDIGPERGRVDGLEGFVINPRDPRQIIANAFFNGVFKSINAGLTWSRSDNGLTSPDDGELPVTTRIRRDPNNPSTLYAVAQFAFAVEPPLRSSTGLFPFTLFRSTNFGDSWVAIASFPDLVVDCAVSPGSPNIIYVLTDPQGLLVSHDRGNTFEHSGNGLPMPDDTHQILDFNSVVITPSNPNNMYVVSSFQDPGGDDLVGGVYKSTDAGLNFTRLGSSPDAPAQVFSHPTDQHIFFLQAFSGSTGLFRTTDGGTTFTEVTAGLPPGKLNFFAAFDPGSPSTAYAAGDGGVFHSTDSGATFKGLGLSLPALTLGIDPTNSHVIYANTFSNGNFKSSNGGRNFIEINNGWRASDVNCFTFDNQSNPNLYVGTGIGFFRTRDRGERYNRIDLPIPNGEVVTAVAVAKTDPNLIVAATSESGIFRSTDGGRSWTKAYIPDFVDPFIPRGEIAIDPRDSTIVYVISDFPTTFYRSTDGGQNFSSPTTNPSDQPIRFSALAIDPNNPLVIFLGSTGFGRSFDRLFKSIDGGVNMSETGVIHGTAFSCNTSQIVINPHNPQEIYVSGRFSLSDPPFSKFSVLRSLDGGATFTPADTGLPSGFALGLMMDPTNPSRLLTWVRVGGLFMSEDGAQSWTPLDTGETLRRSGVGVAMAINPQKPDLLYLGGGSILEVEIKPRQPEH